MNALNAVAVAPVEGLTAAGLPGRKEGVKAEAPNPADAVVDK